MVRQTIPNTGSSDRKRSVSDCRQPCTGTANEQRRCRTKPCPSGKFRRLEKLICQIRRRHSVEALVNQNGELILDPSGAFSQYNWRSSGLTWSRLGEETSRAAAFSTDCIVVSAGTSGCQLMQHCRNPVVIYQRHYQLLENGSRHGSANATELGQYRKTSRYSPRDMCLHWQIGFNENSKITNHRGGQDMSRRTHGNCGSWWRRRPVADQRISVFAGFNWSRLACIHDWTSSMHWDIVSMSSRVAFGRQ